MMGSDVLAAIFATCQCVMGVLEQCDLSFTQRGFWVFEY